MTADDLDPVDRAALELAMQMARREEGRGRQLDAMLKGGDSWFRVAQFAAFCCQTTNLHLKPWQEPPMWIDPDDPNDKLNPQSSNGRHAAAKLLRQMRELGISDFHPDPLAAIEQAKRG